MLELVELALQESRCNMLEQRVDNELRLWNEYYNNDGVYLNDILIAIFAYLGKENR